MDRAQKLEKLNQMLLVVEEHLAKRNIIEWDGIEVQRIWRDTDGSIRLIHNECTSTVLVDGNLNLEDILDYIGWENEIRDRLKVRVPIELFPF